MARTRLRLWDDVYGWVLIALGCGLMLLFLGYQSCTTGAGAAQNIGGTPRDLRCHALIGHRGLLYALLVALPPLLTLAAGLVRPVRRVTMTACVATSLVLLGYVVYLTNAASSTLAP